LAASIFVIVHYLPTQTPASDAAVIIRSIESTPKVFMINGAKNWVEEKDKENI